MGLSNGSVFDLLPFFDRAQERVRSVGALEKSHRGRGGDEDRGPGGGRGRGKARAGRGRKSREGVEVGSSQEAWIL